jgi:RNA polymerase sigma-70 factor (ECF subfamily)
MSSATPTRPLEYYRPLLRLYARQIRLDPRLRRRFDSSDLVQESLLRAHAGLGRFRGQTEGELVAWLRAILERVAIDQTRAARAGKRDPALEQSLQVAVADSSARLEQFLAAGGPSPSSAAEQGEVQVRLAAAIDQLPDDQRDAVILRDLYREPVGRIAAQLRKTERAVAGLLLRGRRRLRELLPDLRGG